MNEIYKSVHKSEKVIQEINRSEFITRCFFTESEDEALTIIEKISEKHRDATHNCYAYVIGKNRLIKRFNDDGEPSGTAGMPILEVIDRMNLTNITIIVTRYFGGIKLGAGGLVRAYAGGAAAVLKKATIVEKRPFYLLKCTFDYTFLGVIENYFSKANLRVVNKEYLERVSLSIYLDIEKEEKIKKELIDITSDEIDFEILSTIDLSTKDGQLLL